MDAVLVNKSMEEDGRASGELEHRKYLYDKLFLNPLPTTRLTPGLKFDPSLRCACVFVDIS
jgi:hypothetical protein